MMYSIQFFEILDAILKLLPTIRLITEDYLETFSFILLLILNFFFLLYIKSRLFMKMI